MKLVKDYFMIPRKQAGRNSAIFKRGSQDLFFHLLLFRTKKITKQIAPLFGGYLLLRPFSPTFISSERSRSVERRTKNALYAFFRPTSTFSFCSRWSQNSAQWQKEPNASRCVSLLTKKRCYSNACPRPTSIRLRTTSEA